jgi:transcriptional regulator GlxA family with amidase domain
VVASATIRGLVGRYASLCAKMGPTLDMAGQNTMAQHMVQLVVLMVETRRDVGPADQHALVRLQLIQAHVLENLGDRGLTIAEVAARAGMSPRQIQRLFKQSG